MIGWAMIAETVSAARSMRSSRRRAASLRLRLGQQAQQDFGEDAQRALRADEDFAQRIAGHVLHALVADPGDLAGGQHDLEAHHVILRHAVLQPAQAAGVASPRCRRWWRFSSSRDRADRAGPPHRPRSKMACVVTPGSTSMVRFCRSSSSMRSNCVRQRTTEPGAARAAGESGAAAARDERRARLVGPAHHGGNFRRLWAKTTAAGNCASAAVPSKE